MPFRDAIARVQARVRSDAVAAFDVIIEETGRSIVDGSPLTGAPGQPVRSGRLKASFRTTRRSPTRAMIASDLPHARIIEEGIGAPQRSAVGGPHSVALTAAGFANIVRHAVRVVRGAS